MYEVIELPDGKYFADGYCEVIGKRYITNSFNYDDYKDCMEGVPAQDALPYLNENDRDFLVYGWCPEGKDELEYTQDMNMFAPSDFEDGSNDED